MKKIFLAGNTSTITAMYISAEVGIKFTRNSNLYLFTGVLYAPIHILNDFFRIQK